MYRGDLVVCLTYVLVLRVECSDRSVESDSYDVKSIYITGERDGGRQQKLKEKEKDLLCKYVYRGGTTSL